jgi:deazaflavin-dependent oxidoreductase (nitroreductase family)
MAVAVLVAAALLLTAAAVLKAAHRTGHAHGRFERTVLRVITVLIRGGLRLGIRLGPMAMLTVPGRTSGIPRTNPVDLWADGERRYLVATHDDRAAWVRNLRAAGHGTVWWGRTRWTFTAAELPQPQAGEVIHRVLAPRMRRPVAGFVLRQTIATPPDAPLADFVTAAATHPVFELTGGAP